MDTLQFQLLKEITSFLEDNKIPYMVTGAWSVIFYGRPRASHDIDFVIELNKKEIQRVLDALSQLSGEFLVQKEVVSEAVVKKGMFNILHLPTMLKMDFWLLQDEPFDRSRFSRKIKVKILDSLMNIASAEDTILQKLRWYEESQIEKHLVDAAFVYQIQKKNLDKKYLNFWTKELKVEKYFKELNKINLEKYL